jgi:hypothetical protein
LKPASLPGFATEVFLAGVLRLHFLFAVEARRRKICTGSCDDQMLFYIKNGSKVRQPKISGSGDSVAALSVDLVLIDR